MSHVVPMIRAAALMPMIRWMHINGRPIEVPLRASGLDYISLDDPMLPIPLISAAAFFREMARAEGPDISFRVIGSMSVLELAMLGKLALGTRTPREALTRVVSAMPYHCSHENLSVERADGHMIVRDQWTLDFDAETHHQIQQFFVAMLSSMFGLTSAVRPHLSKVRMLPHPESGFDHLRRWVGDRVVITAGKTTTLFVPDKVADSPFRRIARDRLGDAAPPGVQPLRGNGRLEDSARIILAQMIGTQVPTITEFAGIVGMTVRTFQRRLGEEGTSFSALLDQVRRDLAIRILQKERDSLSHIAVTLGYSRQASLTRSVQRWTGRAPSKFRGEATAS